jgi:hypothetical protein
MTVCTRCDGTGFLNHDQFPADLLTPDDRLSWLESRNAAIERMDCSCHIAPPCARCELLHDISVCDCCGDGENWHGTPGEHYTAADPMGGSGPYAYNGGLCECH